MALDFTGERFVPGLGGAQLRAEHLARYRFACNQRVAGREVVDLGCGAGYGAALIKAAGASTVLGVDRSVSAVAHARRVYGGSGARFLVADAGALPVRDSTFRIAVCFEVLEHVAEPEKLVAEARRVLRKGGVYLASTPNRVIYSGIGREPNPFHLREMSRDEFVDLLQPVSRGGLRLYDLSISEGILILRQGSRADRDAWRAAALEGCDPGAADTMRSGEPDYFLAVCEVSKSDWLWRRAARLVGRRPADAGAFFLVPLNLLEPLRRQAGELQSDLAEKVAWARRLDREVEERGRRIGELQRDLDEKIAWARSLERELLSNRAIIGGLQAELDERLGWVRSLEQEIAKLQERVMAEKADSAGRPRPRETDS